MPRKSRIDAPGALHHVIVRGIERSAIFKNTEDYETFLSRLGILLNETSTSCYAWALMKNHLHLLLRSGHVSVSSLMSRLLTSYAQQFNRRHRRSGHLFQNRYKSFLCEDEPYLLELVRYIHLNPIRSHAVKDVAELQRFPWCGHGVIMGKVKREWQDSLFVLSLFRNSVVAARKAYAAFVEKGIDLGKRPDLIGGGLVRSAGGWAAVQDLRKSNEKFASDERILGSSAFVASVLKHANEHYATRVNAKAQNIDMERLGALVCNELSLSHFVLKSPAKQSSITRARAIIAHIAFDILRIKGVDVARHLCVTPAAISKLVIRGRADRLAEKIQTFLKTA